MLGDLLKVVLEGAQTQQSSGNTGRAQGAGGDLMTELLKGVLEGQMRGNSSGSTRPTNQPSDLGGMADIFGDILGGVLGGNASPTQRGGTSSSNPMVNMVASMLSERLGLSPEISRTVVGFALALLMGKMQSGKGAVDTGSGNAQGFDLDDLLEGDYAWESGLAQQLSAKTGLTEDEAAYNLQEAVVMLTQGPAATKPKKKRKQAQPVAAPQQGGLDSLLDTWQVD